MSIIYDQGNGHLVGWRGNKGTGASQTEHYPEAFPAWKRYLELKANGNKPWFKVFGTPPHAWKVVRPRSLNQYLKLIGVTPIKRSRKKNPTGAFKVVIKAIPKRGPKTPFWFNAVHKKFTTSKIGRAKFSSLGNAEVMARSLMKKYTELKRYRVELHRAVT